MYKTLCLFMILALAVPLAMAQPAALDLMLQGRYTEARALIEKSQVSPRYQILFFALTEADAARACSLYQVIAIRYANTDCDSVARARLDQARDMGYVVMPISEWSQAGPDVRPLASGAVIPKPTEEPKTEATAQPVVPQSPEPVAVTPIPTPSPPAVPAPSLPKVETVQTVTTPAKPETVAPPPAPLQKQAPEAEVKETSPDTSEQSTEVRPEEATEEEPVSVPDSTAKADVNETEAPVPPQPVEQPPVVTPPIATPPVANVQPLPDAKRPHDLPAPREGHWYVQVGAFGNPDNAHRLAKKLEVDGFPIKLVPRETKSGTLLQVRVGGYLQRTECDPVAEKLKADYSLPAVVLSE